jgi:hypothetical protein
VIHETLGRRKGATLLDVPHVTPGPLGTLLEPTILTDIAPPPTPQAPLIAPNTGE